LKLDNIEWKNLEHAYGAADDIPDLILGLQSEDREVFDKSLYELFGNIWHQGTIYEATVYALPFLMETLKKGESIDLESVAMLVACIASGTGYHQVHSVHSQENPFSGRPIEKPDNLDELLNSEDSVVCQVRSLVSADIEVLYQYSKSKSSEVRRCIYEALGYYPSFAERSLYILNKANETEDDEDILFIIEESIGLLGAA